MDVTPYQRNCRHAEVHAFLTAYRLGQHLCMLLHRVTLYHLPSVSFLRKAALCACVCMILALPLRLSLLPWSTAGASTPHAHTDTHRIFICIILSARKHLLMQACTGLLRWVVNVDIMISLLYSLQWLAVALVHPRFRVIRVGCRQACTIDQPMNQPSMHMYSGTCMGLKCSCCGLPRALRST